jgi:hypothetical protein
MLSLFGFSYVTDKPALTAQNKNKTHVWRRLSAEMLCRVQTLQEASTSETSVNFYQTTRRDNPENSHVSEFMLIITLGLFCNRAVRFQFLASASVRRKNAWKQMISSYSADRRKETNDYGQDHTSHPSLCGSCESSNSSSSSSRRSRRSRRVHFTLLVQCSSNPNVALKLLPLSLRIRHASGSSFGQDTGYPDWCLPRFSSSTTAKGRNVAEN